MGLTLELDFAVYTRSYPGSPRGGDTGLIIPNENGALVALIDATGHGLGAYAIAQKAKTIIQQNANVRPDKLLLLTNEALTGTDGAAILIASIAHHTVTYCGVGNVMGRIHDQTLQSKLGIVGWRMRQPELHTQPFAAGRWLIMHTDGVSSPNFIPAGPAQTIVRTLVETLGSDVDDASALAVRWQEKV